MDHLYQKGQAVIATGILGILLGMGTSIGEAKSKTPSAFSRLEIIDDEGNFPSSLAKSQPWWFKVRLIPPSRVEACEWSVINPADGEKVTIQGSSRSLNVTLVGIETSHHVGDCTLRVKVLPKGKKEWIVSEAPLTIFSVDILELGNEGTDEVFVVAGQTLTFRAVVNPPVPIGAYQWMVGHPVVGRELELVGPTDQSIIQIVGKETSRIPRQSAVQLISEVSVVPAFANAGVLLSFIFLGDERWAEPGQPVSYSIVSNLKRQLIVRMPEGVEQSLSMDAVTPYDSHLTLSRLYLDFANASAGFPPEETTRRFVLVRNLLHTWPSHLLAKDFRRLLWVYAHESLNQKINERFLTVEAFALLEQAVRELKPLGQDEGRLILAHLYRRQNEWMSVAPEAKLVQDGRPWPEAELKKIRRRAIRHYQSLTRSKVVKVRETARVALDDLKRDRRAFHLPSQ